jgi:O-methyltransferase
MPRLIRRGRPERPLAAFERALLDHADPEDRRIIDLALPYTMTGVPRMLALLDAVRYCVRRGVPGAFVECGVWRGGSVLAMLLTLQDLGTEPRDIYLYDTFEGMTPPTEEDVSDVDPPALETWQEAEREGRTAWAELFSPELTGEAAVRRLLTGTGYPESRLHFVCGPVEQTIPRDAPDEIALLRLDTDWYESTRHELTHLFPRLRSGGVLVIDDYGHWRGARRAVDEYFSTEHPPLLLNRIDYTGRLAVKQ